MKLTRAPNELVTAEEELEEGVTVHTVLLPAQQARRLSIKLVKQFSGLFSELLQDELNEEEEEGKKQSMGESVSKALPRLFDELQKQNGIFDVYEELVKVFFPQTRVMKEESEGRDREYNLKDSVKADAVFAGDGLLELAVVTFCLRANFKSFLEGSTSGRAKMLFQKAAGMTD